MAIDTHTHLDQKIFDKDRNEVIKRALSKKVEKIINIGSASGKESCYQSLEIAKKWHHIYSTIGVHPHVANKFFEENTGDELRKIALHKKIVAYGEIGLDFHYDFCEKDIQIKSFREQLELAADLALPIIIHCREAYDSVYKILKKNDLKYGGVLHCFTEGPEIAKKFLDLNFYISIPGVITFKNAEALKNTVKEISLDRILVETDCPFLAPIPMRGKRNEPGYIWYTIEKIAEIRGVGVDEIDKMTSGNAERFFGI